MTACLNGQIVIARMLPGEFHADIDIQDEEGKTAEDFANSCNNRDMFQTLFAEIQGYFLKWAPTLGNQRAVNICSDRKQMIKAIPIIVPFRQFTTVK